MQVVTHNHKFNALYIKENAIDTYTTTIIMLFIFTKKRFLTLVLQIMFVSTV